MTIFKKMYIMNNKSFLRGLGHLFLTILTHRNLNKFLWRGIFLIFKTKDKQNSRRNYGFITNYEKRTTNFWGFQGGIYLTILFIIVFCLTNLHSEKNDENPFYRQFRAISDLPIYISAIPNINDYNIFANGGWDGNWYVGYDVCWIKKLPPVPEGNYRKAFIGVKLGRAKTRQKSNKPIWEKEPIPGNIYVGISSTPSWKAEQRFFLTSTEDIPLEPDFENALIGVGESRWFWAEIPLEQIQYNSPNFIAVWSPTEGFVSRSTCPILCGAWGTKTQQPTTWLNNEILGSPPIDPNTSLKTPISIFEPAIILKLIPSNTEREIEVNIVDIKEGKPNTQDKTIYAIIYSNEILRAYLEMSVDGFEWKKIGHYLYSPPWIFTLSPENLPEGKIFIKVVCEDIWSNYGKSPSVGILVSSK